MKNETKHALGNITDGLANTLNGATTYVAHALDKLTADLANTLDDLTKGLADFLNDLTSKDKEKQPSEAEKKEAYATLAAWKKFVQDEEKSRALGQAADYIKNQFKASEHGAARDSEHSERLIEVPQHIKDLTNYSEELAHQRAQVAQEQAKQNQGLVSMARMELAEAREQQHERDEHHAARQDPATPGVEKDDFDPYERAATALEAKMLENGHETEGEVLEIAQFNGANFYILEQDGERLAVPAGDTPEYQKGDEICVCRSHEGFETTEGYSYGR